MITKKFEKPLDTRSRKAYAEAALWCGEHDAVIVERGADAEYPNGFFEVVTMATYEAERIAALSHKERAAAELATAKSERAAAVAALTVEVDGMVFDGDEKAQERMARAVLMAESPEETTEWVLADNTVALVTADQLKRACRAAGQAQTALWTVPYRGSAL